MLIHLMKKETLDGKPLIEHPIYRDRLMQIQGKVLAQQSHALRLLSAKLNPGSRCKNWQNDSKTNWYRVKA